MKYRATIVLPTGEVTEIFDKIQNAAEWLDSLNNNLESDSIIEIFDNKGEKKDSFFYTMRAK